MPTNVNVPKTRIGFWLGFGPWLLCHNLIYFSLLPKGLGAIFELLTLGITIYATYQDYPKGIRLQAYIAGAAICVAINVAIMVLGVVLFGVPIHVSGK